MLASLTLAAFLLGLAGIPHCAAMCGAACAVALPRGVPLMSLLGRCLAYALLGALVAMSTSLLGHWGRNLAFLKPFWVMAQAAAFLLGAYLLVFGRVPPVLDGWGQSLYFAVRAKWGGKASEPARELVRHPGFALLAGMAWAVLPCGLLYAALTVAALASSGWGGALVMLAFALPGAFGVWAAPAVLRKLTAWGRSGTAAATLLAPATASPAVAPVLWFPSRQAASAQPVCEQNKPGSQDIAAWPEAPGFDPRWAIRISGAMLLAMTAWALYHQVLEQWRAWCA